MEACEFSDGNGALYHCDQARLPQRHDLLAENIDIKKILAGPETREFDLSPLGPEEKARRLKKYQFMRVVGILRDLVISENTVLLTIDKDLLAKKFALVSPPGNPA